MKKANEENKNQPSGSDLSITISVNVPDVLAFKEMLMLGRLFARQDSQDRAQRVMDRIAKKFMRLGLSPETAKRLTDLSGR